MNKKGATIILGSPAVGKSSWGRADGGGRAGFGQGAGVGRRQVQTERLNRA